MITLFGDIEAFCDACTLVPRQSMRAAARPGTAEKREAFATSKFYCLLVAQVTRDVEANTALTGFAFHSFRGAVFLAAYIANGPLLVLPRHTSYQPQGMILDLYDTINMKTWDKDPTTVLL